VHFGQKGWNFGVNASDMVQTFTSFTRTKYLPILYESFAALRPSVQYEKLVIP